MGKIKDINAKNLKEAIGEEGLKLLLEHLLKVNNIKIEGKK